MKFHLATKSITQCIEENIKLLKKKVYENRSLGNADGLKKPKGFGMKSSNPQPITF